MRIWREKKYYSQRALPFLTKHKGSPIRKILGEPKLNLLMLRRIKLQRKKLSRIKNSLLFSFSLTALSACSTPPTSTSPNSETETNSHTEQDNTNVKKTKNSLFDHIRSKETPLEKDRAAILAMQGEYGVSFHFHETVILDPMYARYPAKDSGAYETVILINTSPDHIVLQHILVIDEHVIKHWRQDWTYNAKTRFEFVADQQWEKREIPLEKQQGYWTQCVYEVSDAPRYCGTGKWNHRYGVSTWTSDRTWRPLPRREYTTRDDYNALNVENRHTVTALGWTHEQDNTKVLRNGKKTVKTLVREVGFNEYQSIENIDFSPAYEYWGKTNNFWGNVRARWHSHLTNYPLTQLDTPVDGMPIIEATFSMADQIITEKKIPTPEEIDAIFDQWVSHPSD